MRSAYDERRWHIVHRINAIPGLHCVMPKGAFYVMMDISGILGKYCGEVQINDSMKFAELLLENANVATVPGSAFCTEGFIRMSYATSMENIDRGLDRITGFVGALEDRI